MRQSMLATHAGPIATPPRVSGASGPGNQPGRRRKGASLGGGADGRHRCPIGRPAGAVPVAQGVFVVEEYEVESESSADSVALAEGALARLMVKLWRARQAGLPGGVAAADCSEEGLDFRGPQCPDVSEQRMSEDQ